mmetsp:Transcript_35258/g.56723  ORF Transcript_35258/g.56723 Transcript_35258/m.56723 type:complete len:357 (-) Transcript_35258:35-1105(-)
MRRTWRFSPCVVLASATLAIAVAAQYADASCAKDSVGMVQTSLDKEKLHQPVIFYNLFIGDNKSIPTVSAMVKEQLQLIPDPKNTEVRINSIGAEPTMSDFNLSSELEKRTKIIAHYPTGWENVTLHDLWSFCRKKGTDPNQLVVYLHSKGSFSSLSDPGLWKMQSFHRGYVTRGALSQECLHMPKDCNICSTRMTPFPYTQTPGNMWAARCGYVANLKDPLTFSEDMMKTPDDMPSVSTFGMRVSGSAAFCRGRSRYAHEHWVHSHPQAAPCDLDTNASSSYGEAPPWQFSSDFEKDLQKAPRFNLETFRWRRGYCVGVGEALPKRLQTYRILYDTEPAADWWGWSFFGAERPVR